MIEEFISRYNSFDLYKKISVLSFYPENQHYSATLYHLLGKILSSPFNDGDQISRLEVKKLIEIAEGQFGHLNDPYEQAFTEELSFYDGSHTIFPGYHKNSRYLLEHLLYAIYKSKLSRKEEFRDAATTIVTIFFKLSDEIVQRMGLKRYTKVTDYQGYFIPQKIGSAIDSITFTEEELLGSFKDKFLLEIFRSQLSFKKEEYQFHSEAQLDIQATKPFLNFNEEFVISDPGNLINSLRIELFKIANHYSLIEELCSEYHRSVWNNISKNCRSLDWKRVKIDLPEKRDFDQINEGVWGFDIDKCVYAISLQDHLNEHDFESAFGNWNTVAQNEKIINRINECVNKLTEIEQLDKVFVIIFISSLGRNLFWALPNIDNKNISSILSINAGEFEILAFLEGGDKTILYKFSTLLDELVSNSMLMNQNTLDLYKLFKSKNYSFYLGDERRPDTFFLSFGEGRYLINEYLDRFDRHTVLFHDRKSFTQVIRLEPEPEIPIYLPLTLFHGDRIRSLLIEGYNLPIWVKENEEIDKKLLPFTYNFLQMLSYWIWQLTEDLNKYIKLVSEHVDLVILTVSLEDTDEWFSQKLDKESSDSTIASFELKDNSDTKFIFKPLFKLRASTSDNKAEREFLAIFLESISETLKKYGYDDKAKELTLEQNKIINKVAPIGLKRRIIGLESITNYKFDETNLPKNRFVQAYDEDVILDEVGTHIIHELNYEIKTYEGADAVKILNESVKFLFNELTSLLDEVPFEKALNFFIAQNERLIQNREINKLSVPTNIACYSNESQVVKSLIESTQNNTKTSLANRFVIEYLSAVQPNGSKQISELKLDRIMALASEIINFAFQSDMVHFDLIDNKIPILPSERLGLNTDLLKQARESFLPLQSEEYIRSAKNRFSSYWKSKDFVETPNEIETDQKLLNEAFKDEFGIHFQSYLKIYGDIISYGLQDQNQPYKVATKKSLIEYISLKKDLSHNEIELALDLISYKKRKYFLKPPSPYTPEDVYPWRFMRPLSYLLKPVISLNDATKTKFIWGTRGMMTSADYLISVILNGRMQSRVTSDKLKSYMAKTHKDIGDSFNNYCFNRIKELYPQIIVEEQIKKIGKNKIENNGNDLGDIDIFVISKEKKNIIILECKDLSIARNPREMANEIDSLIKGRKNKNSTVSKHLSRTEWVKGNFDKVVDAFSLKPRGNWKFYPVIIVDEELFTPHLKESEIPILSLERFLNSYKKYF